MDPFTVSRARAAGRAAEAMVRTLGGGSATLRLPASAGDPDGLGLLVPVLEDVTFKPVASRRLLAGDDGRLRLELLFPVAAVDAQVEERSLDSAQDLFSSALGVILDTRLLHIERVEAEFFAGVPYLYRVIVLE